MVKGLFAKTPFAIVGKRKNGREKRIRTSGPCLPKAVLYQAELFPDWYSSGRRPPEQGSDIEGVFLAFKSICSGCQNHRCALASAHGSNTAL